MSTLWSKLSAKPWLRAQACLAAMGAVLFAGSATYATYRAKDSATQLGSEILRSVEPQGDEVIDFNGARFHFSAGVVGEGVQAVVARATQICEQENQDMARELGPALSRLPASALVGQKLEASQLLTLKNSDSSSVGEVGCWRRRSGTAKRFMERVKRFAESGDLAELGSLSYVRAERHGEKTLVRALWSEGRLAMTSLFPEQGDAPGEDLHDVPRPSGATRILSARVLGTARHVVGYDTALPASQLNQFYTSELAKNGWHELDLGAKEPPSERLSHAFQRAGRRALLALTPNGHGTSATFVELTESL
jgi:hypothetical protein